MFTHSQYNHNIATGSNFLNIYRASLSTISFGVMCLKGEKRILFLHFSQGLVEGRDEKPLSELI